MYAYKVTAASNGCSRFFACLDDDAIDEICECCNHGEALTISVVEMVEAKPE